MLFLKIQNEQRDLLYKTLWNAWFISQHEVQVENRSLNS